MAKHPSKIGSDYEEVLAILKDLALDLRWSWDHSVHLMWRMLESDLWERTHNPLLLLQTISRERLVRVADTKEFKQCLRDILLRKQTGSIVSPLQEQRPNSPAGPVAYFSMEYMLSEALPIYSGGLGNVAGDLLKAASDLQLPVVAIGMLFQQGYFRQEIDVAGRQQALLPFNDPSELPIIPVRTQEGEWVRVELSRPNYRLWLRAWQARVGSVTLYLLDTNDPANDPVVRLIGNELYGGDSHLRLRQEVVLGIGGWQLLRELGIEPTVCHLNEGHAAFAVLERARCFMEDTSQSFGVALTATRAGNVFTTHTPVAAGIDRFSPQLMEAHLRSYAEEYLHISFKEFMALGRKNPEDENEPFNVAYLAMKGSGAANGVSRVHGAMSRQIFRDLYPRWPETEVPIGHVTNGIHVPTWASATASALWNEGLARSRGDITPLSISGPIQRDILADISDRQLWDLRCEQRARLVAFARRRLATQLANIGVLAADGYNPEEILDPNVLTLVFARRFAEYKRPTLLLHDRDRLARILTDEARPAQLIIAGKAHPADGQGQWMIQQWNTFIKECKLQHRVVFLADYDMRLTQALVRGADVWINTPRRPWEASGTSGMKVLVNGGLNLSERDGWWAEAFSEELGWEIGNDGEATGDAADAQQLYDILEKEVKGTFYERNADGIPPVWVAKMRASMSRLTSKFSAHRTLSEYIEVYYRPAELAYKSRSADNGKLALETSEWSRRIQDHWHELRILSREVVPCPTANPEKCYQFVVKVGLGSLKPEDVLVELFAEEPDGRPYHQALSEKELVPEPNLAYLFAGTVPANRPESHYTVRIIPYCQDLQVPLEINCILWEK